MIARSTVPCLGLAQLVSWGVSCYLIGAFGERIAVEFGWSQALIHGGLSAALLVMGLASPPSAGCWRPASCFRPPPRSSMRC